VNGAALSVVGAVSMVNLLRVAEVGLLVGVGPYDRSWLKPIIAGIAAAAVGLGLSAALADFGLVARAVVGIAALGVTYAGVLLALGLNDDDRLVLSRAGRRFRRRRGRLQEPPVPEPETAVSDPVHGRVP
jgi:hypothetical protein